METSLDERDNKIIELNNEVSMEKRKCVNHEGRHRSYEEKIKNLKQNIFNTMTTLEKFKTELREVQEDRNYFKLEHDILLEAYNESFENVEKLINENNDLLVENKDMLNTIISLRMKLPQDTTENIEHEETAHEDEILKQLVCEGQECSPKSPEGPANISYSNQQDPPKCAEASKIEESTTYLPGSEEEKPTCEGDDFEFKVPATTEAAFKHEVEPATAHEDEIVKQPAKSSQKDESRKSRKQQRKNSQKIRNLFSCCFGM